jgi:hypothetical protein
MKNSKIDKNKFIALILKSLKEDIDQFHTNLTKGENYETTLYQWSVNLYNEGKPIDEAIEEINTRRRLVMVSCTRGLNNKKNISTQRKLEKVMLNLRQESCYAKLDDSQKAIINKRVEALADTDLWNHLELLEFAITIIKKIFYTDDAKSDIKTKKNPDKGNGKFLSEFNTYVQPKNIFNERVVYRSTQLN